MNSQGVPPQYRAQPATRVPRPVTVREPHQPPDPETLRRVRDALKQLRSEDQDNRDEH